MGKSTSKIAKVKREKKKEFREHAKTAAAPKGKTITKNKQRSKRRQKKLKAYDLSTLSESLPDLKAPSKSERLPLRVNSKTRTKLVIKESENLAAVMSNPVFQSDPLGAIYQHLQSTQPVTEEKPKRKDNKNGKKKAKRKSKGQSQQSMEF